MTTLHTHENNTRIPQTPPEEHAWCVESSHQTSEGRVLYVRCANCPARRVDLVRPSGIAPVAYSREVSGEESQQSSHHP